MSKKQKIMEVLRLINQSLELTEREQVVFALSIANGVNGVSIKEYQYAVEIARKHAHELFGNNHMEEGFNVMNLVNAAEKILWVASQVSVA